MRDVEEILFRLKKSKFRGKFKLSDKDIRYINDKGLDVIAEHAREFVLKRLAPAQPKNDGKQTPMKGHPIFIAQHATAACCRGCLEKWHKIPKGKALTNEQIDYVLSVILRWIEYNNHRCSEKANSIKLTSSESIRFD